MKRFFTFISKVIYVAANYNNLIYEQMLRAKARTIYNQNKIA